MQTLREWRRVRGLSQVQLAERAGVSWHTVRKIETGEREPTIRMARLLCAELGISLLDLTEFATRCGVQRRDRTGQHPASDSRHRYD